MSVQPTLQTDRLTLRPFTLADAPDVQRLAGEREIATTTLLIPHPYPDGAAEEWIQTHETDFNENKSTVYAVTLRNDNTLIGAIGLIINNDHNHAELGYWIGKPYWGKGYCTEAVRAMFDFGFNTLNLNRIHAHHFGNNPSSGRVLEKTGMKREGISPQHIRKWDEYVDIILYGILRSDYERSKSQ